VWGPQHGVPLGLGPRLCPVSLAAPAVVGSNREWPLVVRPEAIGGCYDGGYLPFLPFLSGFAFLSLATLVSFEQVDAAQARASVGHPWPLATGGSVAVGVGKPRFDHAAAPWYS